VPPTRPGIRYSALTPMRSGWFIGQARQQAGSACGE
jgi:hypothetical protein